MISLCMLEFLGGFALLEDTPAEIWIFKNGYVTGFYPDDAEDEVQTTEEMCRKDLRRKIHASSTGDRELHRMIGRYE
jgi:hypothetical protein